MSWMRRGAALLLLAAAAFAGGDDLEQENRRLRDEIAALKAGDPEAVLRKAVEDYLAGPMPTDMPRSEAKSHYQGGFTLASDDGLHTMRINVLGRFGWRWARDTGEGKLTQSNFRWQMLRLRLSGNAYTERLTYFVDLEFGPHAGRFTSTPDRISEAYVMYRRIPWQHLRFKGGRIRPQFTAAETSADETVLFADRGLVNEYFTVGRTDGIAIILENLRDERSSLEITLGSGSERFDPDQPLAMDDKRYSYTVGWARTLIGEGNPWHHTAYEGDPYDQPLSTLVLGIGLHFEQNDIPGTPRAKFWQVAFDLVWRRRGNYAALNVFVRHNRASTSAVLLDEDEDVGAQVTFARFLIPRRFELAVRVGWTDYATHVDPGGDLVEVTFGMNYYWKDEKDRFQGHRLRVTVDVGWAERVVTESRTTGFLPGHERGFQFRSLMTFLF